jgi:hypothetical protein
LAALIIHVRRELNFAFLSIKTDHLSDAVVEAMPMRLRQKIDLVHGEIHGSSGDLVQQGLPEMGA